MKRVEKKDKIVYVCPKCGHEILTLSKESLDKLHEILVKEIAE